MQELVIPQAVAAATAIASELGLVVDDATVLHNSNKLALRLLPCDVFARVAHVGQEVAELEVAFALQLAQTGSPVAALDSRVEPRVYERDGFAVTLWTFYESLSPPDGAPSDYAEALERLHAGMRTLDLATPHFTDRVTEAQQLVSNCSLTPALLDADRDLLIDTLRDRVLAIAHRRAPEQLLHGEPHPGNVLHPRDGVRFIDFETLCRGPVEFDLAHVPEDVSGRYHGADPDILHDCRGLVLAMVAAWRWDSSDEFPDGARAGRELVRVLRDGPPWPTLEAVTP
ncbi:MAG: phosphotransferase [Acidimicrobiia bacterium]